MSIKNESKSAVVPKSKALIMKTYAELQLLFKEAHDKSRQNNDILSLRKLEKYKEILAQKVREYNKDPKAIKDLSTEVSKGLDIVNKVLRKPEVTPVLTKSKSPEVETKSDEKENKETKKKDAKSKKKDKGAEVIEDYDIEVDGAKVQVEITKTELGVHYNLHLPEIDVATLSLLNEIRNELVAVTTISMKELTDPKAFTVIKERFMEDARRLISERLPNINEETETFLIGNLIQEMLGLGKIEFLINDPNLEEIVIVSSKEPIRVFTKKYGWLSTNIQIANEEDILNYSNIIARRIGRQITILNPLLDAHLVSGDRINAVLYPINTKGNTITIRKFARDPFTIIDLINNRTCDIDTAVLIWIGIEYEMNIIISGGTASGKTVILNAMLPFIPPNHRIISIEDTRELMLPDFLYWTPLVTRSPNPEGKGEVSMLDLLINSLRMRPDRIILGEMRKHEEAMVLFEAMHTGHSVYATLHADSAQETVNRLTNPPLSIPANLLSAVNLNLVMFRDRRRGIRRISQIAEFEISGNTAVANIIYRWSPENDKIIKHGESNRFMEDIGRNTGMSINEINRNLEEKRKILAWMVKNKLRGIENFGKVMNYFYRNKDLLLNAIEKNKIKLITEAS